MTGLKGNNGQLLPDDVARRHETHSRHILASHRVEILIVPRYGYVSLVWTPASAHSSNAHEPGQGNEKERERFKAFLPSSFLPSFLSLFSPGGKKQQHDSTKLHTRHVISNDITALAGDIAATVTRRFALHYRSMIPTRFHLSHPSALRRLVSGFRSTGT